MNIIVCFKFAPDAEDIEVNRDGTISTEKAEWIIGEYDMQAIEAGMRLAEATGGKVIALSAGPQKINNSKLKKDVLSRGPDELVLVVDDGMLKADTAATAQVLAAAVRKLGGADVVLCGEGSSDLYFQQVGLQLGETLGVPTLNAISKIEAAGDHLTVERSLESEVEVIDVPVPAALSVTTDINQPRLPSMKEILKAAKKPVTEWTLADLADADQTAKVDVLETKAPQQKDRKKVMIPGKPEEAAQALISYLSKEGVL
jgi:electron transfer flavoprotein beta subunit